MAKSFDDLARRTMTPASIARAERRGRELIAEVLLSELRKGSGMSQRELADALGIKQPSLSKLEKQGDMQIATLRRIVEALGGELHLLVKLPGGSVRMSQFDTPLKAKRPARPRTRKAA